MKKIFGKKKLVIGAYQVENPFVRALNYLLLALLTIVVLVPIFIVFNSSFKTDKEYMYSGVFELPKNMLNFENYKIFVEKGHMITGFSNTLILIVISVTLSVVMGSMVAYILGRFDFKLKKLAFIMFFIPTLIPGTLTQAATFSVIKNLHLYNTRGAAIMLYIGADIMSIYIFLQFVEKIPYSLDESAFLEGASYFKIYRSIILPQLSPAMATIIILKVISIYNDMLTPYLYMPKAQLMTVTTALMKFSYDKNSQWNVMGAGIVSVMIPTLILYLFLQKWIFSGITDGAVKD